MYGILRLQEAIQSGKKSRDGRSARYAATLPAVQAP
jgi:hypothetical protein